MRTGVTYLPAVAACLVAAAVSSFAAAALPPVTSLEDLSYSRRVWQSRDGLPEDFVLSLAQTPDGYLWVGTSGGLLRFDGVRFTLFGSGTEPAFHDDSISALLAARDGSLWIGTEGGGLVHYASGKFRSYGLVQHLTNVFVRKIYEDRTGAIWVGTDKGLFRLDGETFTRLDARDGIPPLSLLAICEDSRGRLLAGGTGLLVIDHGSKQFYPLPKERTDEGVRFLKEDARGALWIGTVAGVRKMEDGLHGDPFAAPRVLDVHARVFLESPQGIWIGTTDAGLLRWADGRFTRLVAPASLPNDNVLSLERDREGNIWIGSQGGLTRISPSAARTVHVPSGEPESINTVYADPAGPMLVVSQGGKIYDVQGNALAPHRLPASIARIPFRNAYRSRDGSLWLGTLGRGIYRISATGTVSHLATADGLINDFTRVFLEARDGSLWVGTNGGVSHLRAGKFTNYNFDNGLAYNSVREILEDRGGVVWVATDAGISRLLNGRFLEPGALGSLRSKKVWALYEDDTGGVWIGTLGAGLYLYRNDILTHFPTREGIPDKVHAITEDRQGNLWLTSTSGIVSVGRKNLEKVANGGGEPLAARLFNTSDGLITNQMNGGMQEAVAITPKGELWVPSTAGVVVLSAGASRTSAIPPLLLEQVLAGENATPVAQGSVQGSAPIEIQPGSGKLELHYTAIRLRSPERLRFRYWMEGAEPGWNEVGDRRVAYFTNLSPGKYKFHVASWDVDYPGRTVSRVFPIVLLPAFYQTWWFMLLLAAAATSIAWGAYLLHVRNVRRQFEAVLDERTRLAREMHDTVIQGCVGVSALLEAASSTGESAPEVSRVMIERARDEIRTTVEAARSAVWNLRHTEDGSINEAIASLVRRVRGESGVDIDLETTGHATGLASEAERGVVLSAREALSNAVRHSGASRIVIKLRFTSEWLSIDVVDNGSGFDWPRQASGYGMHYGLIGMKERMEKLGGSFDLQSTPGQGTRVRLRVPLPKVVIDDPRRTHQSV